MIQDGAALATTTFFEDTQARLRFNRPALLKASELLVL
jgi:hypothetical protein